MATTAAAVVGASLDELAREGARRMLEAALAAEVIGVLLGPAIAEQPRDGHLQRLGTVGGIALEEPLGRIIRAWLRQRPGLFSNLLPMFEVKGHLYESDIGDLERSIDTTNCSGEDR